MSRNMLTWAGSMARLLSAQPATERMSSFLRRSARALGAITIALVAVSCSADVTGPAALIGSYRLSLYDGAVVPVTLSEFTETDFIGGLTYPCQSRFSGAALSIEEW
ncbi:MAG: hypothetical protein M3Z05_17045, partial [Gemmatimonadota bacterium]|nr:hypothetical protein [Gemmatimonadota bacterium]